MSSGVRVGVLFSQLGTLLRVTGVRPRRWLSATVAASVVLAVLDMAGVAAMIPLMQLITAGKPQGAVLEWVASWVGSDDLSALIPVIAGFVVVVFIVKSIGSLMFRWWLLGRTTKITALSSAELFHRYVSAPYATHRTRAITTVYRNINDATGQASSVLLAVVTLCSDVLMLVAIMAVLAVAAPLVTLFAIVLFGGIVMGVQRLLRARQLRIGEDLAEASLASWQFLMPGIDGFRETRLTASASSFVTGFRQSRLRRAQAAREMGFLSDVPRYLLEVAFIVAIVGVAAIMFLTGDPDQVITILGLFATASMRALPTMNRVSAGLATIRTGQAGLRIMVEALDELGAEVQHDEKVSSSVVFDGDIVLHEVTFGYADAAEPVLKDLSLTVAQNRTTAFTGGSGAGKSTVIDLVLGLLRPTAGTITCGGEPIDGDPAAWYQGLGVVPQDVFLLNASITENIAFGVAAADVDAARVREVVAQARLTELIDELPDGYETVVGDRGVRLSGGQRQRIGLARALYRRPRVLVLDEATSALDNVTEHEISQTLHSLQGTMTIIIVAHRLSTVRAADHLVHLRDGRVAASGTFDEVRDSDTEFARLVELGRLD